MGRLDEEGTELPLLGAGDGVEKAVPHCPQKSWPALRGAPHIPQKDGLVLMAQARRRGIACGYGLSTLDFENASAASWQRSSRLKYCL
jgi:hypothetical protein